MRPKRDYDDSLVTLLSRAEAEQLSHNAQDRESLEHDQERFELQLQDDQDHAAFGLDAKVDEDD